jgi:hypothetical protein
MMEQLINPNYLSYAIPITYEPAPVNFLVTEASVIPQHLPIPVKYALTSAVGLQ